MCDFFFNDTATTDIYTLSLHDALPIWAGRPQCIQPVAVAVAASPAVPVSTPMLTQVLALACGLACGEPAAPAAAPSTVVAPCCTESRTTDVHAITVVRARNAARHGEWNEAAELWRDALLIDDRTGAHWVAMGDALLNAERHR